MSSGFVSKVEKTKKNNYKSGLSFEATNEIKKSYYEKDTVKISFDTLQSDLSALGNTIQGVYGGWQTQDTMKKTKSSVKSMYNRLTALQDYRKKYGITEGDNEINELVGAYKTTLDNWDDRSMEYGQHKSAESYNKAIEDAEAAKATKEKQKTEDLIPLQTELEALKPKLDEAKHKQKLVENLVLGIDERQSFKNEVNEILASVGYDSLDDFEKAYTEKEAYLNRAKFVQAGYKLTTNATTAENYEEWSQEGASYEPNDFGSKSSYAVGKGHSTTKIDNYRAAAIALSDWQSGETTEFSQYVTNGEKLTSKYRLMTEDEFKTFAYWRKYDKENGTKLAYDYIDSIEEDLNSREGQATAEKYKDKSALAKILYGVPAGLDQFASGVENALNFTDDYIPTTSTQYASQGIRKQLYDTGFDLPEWLGGSSIGQVAYDAVNTGANMLPSMAAGAVSEIVLPGSGTYVTAGLMGLSASGNAYQSMLNQGYNKLQSRTYATLVGASEATLSALLSGMIGGKATEKVIQTAIKGIDNGFLRFAARWGLEGVSEVPEEMLQGILEPMFQNIAVGYELNNMSELDWSQIAYDGLLGGLSGMGFGFGHSAINTVVEQSKANFATKIYGQSQESMYALVDNGLAMSEGSVAHSQALKADARLKSGKSLSGTALYNLATAIEGEIESKSQARFIELGVDKKIAKELSPAVAKAVFGEELTSREYKTLKNNDIAAQVVKELSNDRANTVWKDAIKNSRINNAANNAVTEQGEVLRSGADGAIDSANDFNYNDNSIKEGESYNGKNTELLERGAVSATNRGDDVLRKQGTNSEMLAACLEISQGNDSKIHQAIRAGESDWIDRGSKTQGQQADDKTSYGFAQRVIRKIQGVKLSGKDTIGGTVSPKILKKIKDTVLKDDKGNLISLYHWTQEIFEEFEKGEFGFHFGTLRAAYDRYLQAKEYNPNISKGTYKEVVLNITNPIELSDASLEWTAGWVAIQLLEKGIISERLYHELEMMMGFNDLTYDNPAAQAVRNILAQNGYDGIIYENLSEDIGSYSIIALYPEQIITVAENGVLKENNSVSSAISKEEIASLYLKETQANRIATDEFIEGSDDRQYFDDGSGDSIPKSNVTDYKLNNISKKDYDKFFFKKPIKVSKKEWAKVNSARTQKYLQYNEDNIPDIDFFRVAEYNQIDIAYKYWVRNYNKYNFEIVSKIKIKPEVSQMRLEEKNYDETAYTKDDSTRVRLGPDRNNSFDSGYGQAIRSDDELVGRDDKSNQGGTANNGISDSRREIDYNITKATSNEEVAFSILENNQRQEIDADAVVDGIRGKESDLHTDVDSVIINKNKYTNEELNSAILRYKSGESYQINAKLRENDSLDKSEQYFVDVLNEALKQLPVYEGTVYRNIVFDDFGGEEAYNEFLKKHILGGYISYEQFLSCSKEIDGYQVDGKYQVHFVIESKNVRDVDGFGNNMESEVIYPLNSVFIVDKIHYKNNITTIYLQEAIVNGRYSTDETKRDTVQHMQTQYFTNTNMQSVSRRNSVGNTYGRNRPQSTTSIRQWNSVRGEGRHDTILSASLEEQKNGKIKNKATSNEEVAFSMPIGKRRSNVNKNVIELPKDNELSKRIFGLYSTEKYKEIQKYIFDVLGGQNIVLSDGKKATVDKSDARHISQNAGSKKAAQISAIKELVEKAVLIAEEESNKGRKFDYFYYYKAAVKYDGEIFNIYLNVGRATNDKSYHLYDITQKLRDTAHRINGVGRPKPKEGYALKNGISNNIIPKTEKYVNNVHSTNTDNIGYDAISEQEQKYVQTICDKLGRTVVFEDLREMYYKGEIISPDGYIENGVIHLNIYAENPIGFVFKHELTHFVEKASGYAKFVSQVKDSSVYKKWLCEKTGENDVKIAGYKYKQMVANTHSDIYSVSDPKAEAEMIADFVGEMLFTDNGSGMAALVSDIEVKHRNKVIQFVLDLISYLKKKLSGINSLTLELSVLEDSFSRIVAEATDLENKGLYKYDDDISFCFVACTDQERINAAEELERQGYNSLYIFENCGLIKDAYGKWKYELNTREFMFYADGNARTDSHYFNYKLQKPDGSFEGRLCDFVLFNSLFELYPQLKDITVIIKNADDTVRFIINEKENGKEPVLFINKRLSDDFKSNRNNDIKSHILRELQRAIQYIDGEYIGKSLDYWEKMEKEGKTPYSESFGRKLTAKEAHRYTADNYESKIVETRRALRDTLRKTDANKGRNLSNINEVYLYSTSIERDMDILFDDNDNPFISKEYSISSKDNSISDNNEGTTAENEVVPSLSDGVEENGGDSFETALKKNQNSNELRRFLSAARMIDKNDIAQNLNIRAGSDSLISDVADNAKQAAEYFNQDRINELSQKILQRIDSIGRTLSNSLLEKFKNTIFKNEKGQMISLYTLKMWGVGGFEHSKLGLVAGTLEAAEQLYAQYNDGSPRNRDVYIQEIFVNMKNPLVLHYTPYEDSIRGIHDLVEREIFFHSEFLNLINQKSAAKEPTYSGLTTRKTREAIQNAGYDGIIYFNDSTDKGSMTVIVLDESQMVTVAKNGILQQNNGITADYFDLAAAEDAAKKVNNDKNIKLYAADSKYNKRKYRPVPDERIKAGNSVFMEKSTSGVVNAKRELEENLAGNNEIALSGKDAAGRTLGKNITGECDKTFFKDKDGNLLSFFAYGKKIIDLEKAIKSRTFFGTLDSAINDLVLSKEKSPRSIFGVIQEFYINSVAPLVVELDNLDAEVIAKQIFEEKIITEKEYYRLTSPERKNPALVLINKLDEKGFDSIVFVKKTGECAVLLFDASQVFPVADNGIVKENSGVTQEDEIEEYNENYRIDRVVIEREGETPVDTREIRNILTTERDNTIKMKLVTKVLMCNNNPAIDYSDNRTAGHSGILEKNKVNILNARAIVTALINRDFSNISIADTDTAGRIISEYKRQFLCESKLIDKHGRPLSVFGFNRYGHNRFKHSQFGLRVSTLNAAHDMSLFPKENPLANARGFFEEYYPIVKNPYFVTFDPENLTPAMLAKYLLEEGTITNKQYERVLVRLGADRTAYHSGASNYLTRILKEKGFDSLAFMNERADPGSIGLIVFDKSQLIPVAIDGLPVENSDRTLADSDNEPAFFMPENDGENFVEKSNENKFDIDNNSWYNKTEKAKCRNERLEGGNHSITDVPFVKKQIEVDGKIIDVVVPEFDSLFDAQLPEELYKALNSKQIKECNLQLCESFKLNDEISKQFDDEQIKQIKERKTPYGYTWHHDVAKGMMQLVDCKVHRKTGHTGGQYFWGGGTKNR